MFDMRRRRRARSPISQTTLHAPHVPCVSQTHLYHVGQGPGAHAATVLHRPTHRPQARGQTVRSEIQGSLESPVRRVQDQEPDLLSDAEMRRVDQAGVHHQGERSESGTVQTVQDEGLWGVFAEDAHVA